MDEKPYGPKPFALEDLSGLETKDLITLMNNKALSLQMIETYKLTAENIEQFRKIYDTIDSKLRDEEASFKRDHLFSGRPAYLEAAGLVKDALERKLRGETQFQQVARKMGTMLQSQIDDFSKRK